MQNNATWFKIWFDSPYYHKLYKHRDHSEAGQFVSNLVQELKLAEGRRILDMGCGKGRHCIFLNELGFDVVGIDLSGSNIAAANNYASNDLHFIQHDMRQPLKGLEFDLVLNLFTSFGYFESASDNLSVLEAAVKMLAERGRFVLDFLNAPKVVRELNPAETRNVEGTKFEIRKSIEDGIIVKRIQINDNPELQFEERVQALDREKLFDLFEEAGLAPIATYGSYHFEPFDETHSDRLIIIAEK